ncbi:MAG: hypothetical protein LQ348_003013 [Seirophora lacunosa]|nr:MAG: hypothetical protein LQ348_003013 [Seirophora lacunosa]
MSAIATTPSGGAASAQKDMSTVSSTTEETQEEHDSEKEVLRYADVGINLTDDTYRGFYNHHSKPTHPPDLDAVLQRASSVGVRKFLVTGSDLKQSSDAINLSKQYPGQCYATVGVHPCSAMAFEEAAGGGEALLEELRKMAEAGKRDGHVKAFGEIGLDYDRLHFCKQEVQEKWFKRQLDVAVEVKGLHFIVF